MDRMPSIVKPAILIGVVATMLFVASSASAQVAASIGGTAKDTSGAVLPGVTVEASSPALIEKTRAVVTDAQGNYKIVDLRPGTYAVTFSLEGFSTVRREGIDLSAGFNATVNGDLQVGSLAETITVTGASPIVDTQQSRNQQVLKSDTMNALPSGAQNTMAFAAMTLGAVLSAAGRNDVGGDKGEQATGIVLHGGRGDDSRNDWDGMNINPFFGGAGGTQRIYYFNTAAIQEVVIETGGAGAETETGGANVNMVPREGSNVLRFTANAAYTDKGLSSAAIPDYVKARGVNEQTSLKKIWDYSIGVGGPFKQDKLWFYATSRWWGAQNFAANNYFNKSTNPFQYVPDLSRQAYTDQYYNDVSLRITWQMAQKHKISQEEHQEAGCSCWLSLGGGAQVAPESSTDFNYGPQILSQTTYSFTATNRLLIQAGMSFIRQDNSFVNATALNSSKFTGYGTPTFPGPDIHAITELSTGYTYGALSPSTANYSKRNNNNNYNQKVAVSYITGSHAFKVGLRTLMGNYDFTGLCCGVSNVAYTFRNGAPVALSQWAGPFLSKTRLNAQAVYAQDQWTIKRLTLNLGVRFDRFAGRTLPVTVPAGPYTKERSVPGLDDLPNFKDIVPRLGAAYDLFGNGKTALKVSFGKYLVGLGGSLSQQGFAPATAILTNVSRTWTDNGNFVPDCDLTNQAANGECGVGNPLFGQPNSVLNLADDARKGWGNRVFNYQYSVQLQHELRPGMGMAVGFFRTWWGNLSVTQNTRVTPADFTEYCITAPTDNRLGPTSGQQICGLYDVNPNKFGQVNYLVQKASSLGLGEAEDKYSGVEISYNWRGGRGALLNGGVSIGRESFDYCYANGHPELTPENFPVAYSSAAKYPRTEQFCRVTSNWWNGIGSQAKAQFVYPLPYDINISGTWKTLPGVNVTSNYVLTAAQVAGNTTLGRTPTGVATVTHSLIPVGNNGQSSQGTVFDHRLYQTDFRLAKVLRFGARRLTGNFDIYNLFNNRPPQGINPTYSATNTFTLPTSLLGGRLFKFGATFDF